MHAPCAHVGGIYVAPSARAYVWRVMGHRTSERFLRAMSWLVDALGVAFGNAGVGEMRKGDFRDRTN